MTRESGWIMTFAVSYFIVENNHFGWNMLPKSDSELIADGVFLLIASISVLASKS